MRKLIPFFLFFIPVSGFCGTPQIIYSAPTTQTTTNAARIAILQGMGATTFLATANELNGATPTPSPGTWSNFYVMLDSAPGTGKSYAFTLRTSTNSSGITCTVSDLNNSCSDITHSSTTIAGETVALLITPSGTPSALHAAWSIQFSPTTSNQYVTYAQGSANTGSSVFNPITGGATFTGTEANGKALIASTGTYSNLYVRLSALPGVGKSYAFTVKRNNVATTITCTIADTANSCSDVVNSTAVVAGDTIDLNEVPTGTPAAAIIIAGLQFVPTTAGEFPVIINTLNALSNSTSNYYALMASQQTGQTVETVIQAPTSSSSPSVVFKKLRVMLAGTAGASASYVFTLRQNTASPASGPTCTISGGSATSCIDESNSVTVANSDLMDQLSSPSGTPTARSGQISMIGFITQTTTSVIPQSYWLQF